MAKGINIKDQRFQELQDWAHQLFGNQQLEIQPASADASFRRYFRVRFAGESYIIMDAPPDKEDSEPFVRISGYLAELNLNVPKVIESEISKGIYLLTDLGSKPYLDYLNDNTVEELYADAMQALEVIHLGGERYREKLPPYSYELLHREMDLYSDWFLERHLQLQLNDAQRERLEQTYTLLSASALEQPTVFVHRDYHSRNLMLQKVGNPGILDFQDAVWGPVSYDLVSLLRDCYIAWPRERVVAWVKQYYSRLSSSSLLAGVSQRDFLRWFDLMGVQRQLKATGIFARLNYRDNKPGYLNDIPRTMRYVLSVASDYQELKPFLSLLEELAVFERLKQPVAGQPQ
ncbi:MAG: phosphotransferase [Thioalkalispiraceae bacterium]|jgi:hypothetical protein